MSSIRRKMSVNVDSNHQKERNNNTTHFPLQKVKSDFRVSYRDRTPRFKSPIYVDFITYMNRMADYMGIRPDKGAYNWDFSWNLNMVLHFQPFASYRYRLVGPHRWIGAAQTLIEMDSRHCGHLTLESSKIWSASGLSKSIGTTNHFKTSLMQRKTFSKPFRRPNKRRPRPFAKDVLLEVSLATFEAMKNWVFGLLETPQQYRTTLMFFAFLVLVAVMFGVASRVLLE